MTAMFTLVVPNRFQNSRRRGILDIRHQHTNCPGRFFTRVIRMGKYVPVRNIMQHWWLAIGSQLRLRPRQLACGVFEALFLGWRARGRVLPRKFQNLHNWAKPSPRSNPVIMRRTITGILRGKIWEIEASSMGVETLRGYNLHRPSGCNPTTRDHKQSSIFVELADAFSRHTRVLLYFWQRENHGHWNF
jgi:hypothetical protein